MTVTVCIPVRNGAAFLDDALESLARQTFDDLAILVSVDKSDDSSLELAHTFAARKKSVQVFDQATQLGWTANVNFLLRKVDTEFAGILHQDDLLEPSYYEKLVSKLRAQPKAILAFSDIETFGDASEVRVGTEVAGDTLARILKFLAADYAAVAYRGVFRSKALNHGCYLEEASGVAADQTWLLRMAIEGDLVRLPERLYRKRLHPNSLTSGARDSHWADHCAACLRIALTAGSWTLADRRAIAAAAALRATRDAWIGSSPSSPPHIWLMILFAHLADFALRAASDEAPGSQKVKVADLSNELRARLKSHGRLLSEAREVWRVG
jgi:glycosyltransferase involved in cell wall biosynthesis